MNVVFTFGTDGSKRSFGLWAHQSVLSQHSAFARYLDKVANIEYSPGETMKQVHIFDTTWQAFGCMLRFLYTGEIDIEIDPSMLAISAAPVSKSEILKARVKLSCAPVMPVEANKADESAADRGSTDDSASSCACGKSDSTNALSITDISLSPKPEEDLKSELENLARSTWEDLFEVAACYEIDDLRKYCLGKIISLLTPENVLGTLFRIGCRYDDLKTPIANYVVDFLPEVFSDKENPLEPYAGHPSCCAVMASVMRVKANRG